MKNTNSFEAPTDANFKLNIPHGIPIKFRIPIGSSVTVNDEMLGLLEGRPYIKFTCDKNSNAVILESGKSYQYFILNDELVVTPLGDVPQLSKVKNIIII